MRDPKEPGDTYNMKEHVYHDSNIVQGLPNEDLKVHVKDSKQKVQNKSIKKNVYDEPAEQTKLKKNPYDEPHAHQTTTQETSAGKERKQKSEDTSAARSGNSSRGSVPKRVSAKGAPDENRAPKRRELISAPGGIDIESVPISFIENETGESSGIRLISKKDLKSESTNGRPTHASTNSVLTRQTWKEEDSFGTTKKAVVIKPRKQQPVVNREVKHFRRNALIITLFLATILIIVAIVVVCLIALP